MKKRVIEYDGFFYPQRRLFFIWTCYGSPRCGYECFRTLEDAKNFWDRNKEKVVWEN